MKLILLARWSGGRGSSQLLHKALNGDTTSIAILVVSGVVGIFILWLSHHRDI